jgi:hypothetical protein
LLATQAEAVRPTIKLDLADAPDEAVGQTLGRYKLLERVGEGGCGVVYVAEQTEPVRRRVALKVIKLGMDTKQVVARFEAERQALQQLVATQRLTDGLVRRFLGELQLHGRLHGGLTCVVPEQFIRFVVRGKQDFQSLAECVVFPADGLEEGGAFGNGLLDGQRE